MSQSIQLQVTQVGLEQSIAAAMKRVGSSSQINLGTSSKQINALSQPLGRITGQADEFSKSMAAANARVLAFGASAGIIAGVSSAMSGLLSSTIKVEKSLVEISTVLNKTGSELDKFGQDIFNVAKNTGKSFDEVAKGALELARQGLSAEDTLARLNDALILSRLSGLDAAQSVEGLTAAFNSFKSSGITTAEILNKVVAAAQKYSVSEKDIIEGLKRSASVANLAGVSFEELAAVITAVQEKTARGGAVIGNAFKTIFSRIQDKGLLSDLDNMGVAVKDLATGEVLPALKILESLAKKMEGLSQIEKADIAEKVAGGYQLDKLLAALSDLSDKASVTTGALKEMGEAGNSAYKKNAILNQTLAALLNKVAVSAEQLGAKLGEIGVTDSLKNVLGFFNNLLEGIQRILGEENGLGTMVRGLVKGLGNFLAGPGLAIFGAIILKLSKDLVTFGFASLKVFFGIGKAAKEVQDVEGAISQILAKNVNLQQQLFALEGNRAAQLRLITGALVEQEAILRKSASISSGLAKPLYNVGAKATGSGLRVGNSADGYMPAVAKESKAIQKGVGGARAGDKPVVVPNFNFGGGKKGTMVAHTGEYIVPNFNGSGGSAVFNRQMVQSMGLPSGAKKINAAGGLIPNFANKTLAFNKLGRLSSGSKYLLENEEYLGVADIGLDSLSKDAVNYKKTVFKLRGESLNSAANRIINKGSADTIKKALGDAAGSTDVELWLKNRAIGEGQVRPLSKSSKKETVDFKKQKTGLFSAVKGALFENYLKKNRRDIIPFGEGSTQPLDFKYEKGSNSLGIEAKAGSFSSHQLIAKAIRARYGTVNKNNEENTIGKIGNVDLFVPSAASGFIPNFAPKFNAETVRKYADEIQKYKDPTKDFYQFPDGTGGYGSQIKNVLSRQQSKAVANKQIKEKKIEDRGFFNLSADSLGGILLVSPRFGKSQGSLDTSMQIGEIPFFNQDKSMSIDKNKYIKLSGIKTTNTPSGRDLKSLRADVNELFSDGIVRLANRLYGETFDPASGGEFSAKLQSLDASKKQQLLPPAAQGDLFEAAGKVALNSFANLESLFGSGEQNRPFDFQNPEALRKVFGVNAKRGEAKRGGEKNFGSSKQVQGIIKKIFNDSEYSSSAIKSLRGQGAFDFSKAQKAAQEKNAASGFIPNFYDYKLLKQGRDGKREILDKVSRSYLQYSKNDDNLEIKTAFSYKKGAMLGLYNNLGAIAKKSGKKLFSPIILPQRDRLKSFNENSSIDEILKAVYPQLAYREKSNSKNTALKLYLGGNSTDLSGKNIFQKVANYFKNTSPTSPKDLLSSIEDRKVSITSLVDTFADGYIPNFAVDLEKSQDYINSQRKRNFKAGTYRKASGAIGSLFKSLPEKFFTDGILGDGAQGVETSGILNLIKENALYAASFAGPKAIKFVTEAEKYGLKVEKSLKDKLAKLVVKGASKMKGFAGGFLPNFANPLQAAVGREMAAGVPASQIYIDKSPSLKNAANPMGLMVANRRDEPVGGFQGISRARREGANPMMYGAAGGFVPNYAAQVGQVSRQSLGVSQQVSDKNIAKYNQGIKDAENALKKGWATLPQVSKDLETLAKRLATSAEDQKKLSNAGTKLIAAYDKEVKARNAQAQSLKQQRQQAQQAKQNQPVQSEVQTGDSNKTLIALVAFQSAIAVASGFLNEAGEGGRKLAETLQKVATTALIFGGIAFSGPVKSLKKFSNEVFGIAEKIKNTQGGIKRGLSEGFKSGLAGEKGKFSVPTAGADFNLARRGVGSARAASKLGGATRLIGAGVGSVLGPATLALGIFKGLAELASGLRTYSNSAAKSLANISIYASKAAESLSELDKGAIEAETKKQYRSTFGTIMGSLSETLGARATFSAMDGVKYSGVNYKSREVLLSDVSEEQFKALESAYITSFVGSEKQNYANIQDAISVASAEFDKLVGSGFTKEGAATFENIIKMMSDKAQKFKKENAIAEAMKQAAIESEIAERDLINFNNVLGDSANKILALKAKVFELKSSTEIFKGITEAAIDNAYNLSEYDKTLQKLGTTLNSLDASAAVQQLNLVAQTTENIDNIAKENLKVQDIQKSDLAGKFSKIKNTILSGSEVDISEYDTQELIRLFGTDYRTVLKNLTKEFKNQTIELSNQTTEAQNNANIEAYRTALAQQTASALESQTKQLDFQKSNFEKIFEYSEKIRNSINKISDLNFEKGLIGATQRQRLSAQIGREPELKNRAREESLKNFQQDRIASVQSLESLIPSNLSAELQLSLKSGILSATENIRNQNTLKDVSKIAAEEYKDTVREINNAVNKETRERSSFIDQVKSSLIGSGKTFEGSVINAANEFRRIAIEANNTQKEGQLKDLDKQLANKNKEKKVLTPEEQGILTKARDQLKYIQSAVPEGEYLKAKNKYLEKNPEAKAAFKKEEEINKTEEAVRELNKTIADLEKKIQVFLPTPVVGDVPPFLRRVPSDLPKTSGLIDLPTTPPGGIEEPFKAAQLSLAESLLEISNSNANAADELEKLTSVSRILADEFTQLQEGIPAAIASITSQRNKSISGAEIIGANYDLETQRQLAGASSTEERDKITRNRQNKGLGQLFAEEYGKTSEEQALDLKKTIVDGSVQFKNNMIEGIMGAVEGTSSLKDGLRSAAYEFVKMINQKMMSNLADKVVGGNVQSGTGQTSGGLAGFFSNMFASGGKVTGGSGSKDDVPAMLMGGEYVVNKKAVSKYGPKFLEAINNGTLNGYAKGGKVQRGPQGNFYAPGTFGQGAISGKRDLLDFATQTGTSGKFDQMINESGYQSISLEPESSRLSVSGMRNSPQFEATQSAKGQAFDLYLQQYNAEREAKKQAKEQKKALIKQVGMLALSAALGPVINAAGAGFSAAFKGASGQGFMSQVGAGFKGIVSGGTVGNQQVGGLSNLFSSAGKAFSGDFAGAANQFKMSQIGNGNQLSDLYKSDPKFASYIDSMGGINTSGAPVATIISEARGFSATRPNASIPIEAARSPSGVVLKDGDIPNWGEKSDVPPDGSPMVLPPKPRAIGGMIPSTSGIDTVPAMLSGGEFVMNRSAVQSIGAPNLQSMNSGGTSITSEETSKELNEKLLAKLDELIGASGSTGNITINVAPSGQTSQENSQDPSASRQQLARQIKDAVLQIINDEKRIGGTLRR